MCFDNDDYDWVPEVTEDETAPSEKQTRCDECGRMILVGEPVRHIFMQEREDCRHDPDSDDYEGEGTDAGCPEGCEHDYGETFDYDRCETCNQLIEAIHQHEIAEGCKDYESRPTLTELREAMHYGDGAAYLAKAEALYPGITARLSPALLPRVTVE